MRTAILFNKKGEYYLTLSVVSFTPSIYTAKRDDGSPIIVEKRSAVRDATRFQLIFASDDRTVAAYQEV